MMFFLRWLEEKQITGQEVIWSGHLHCLILPGSRNLPVSLWTESTVPDAANLQEKVRLYR